MLQLPIYNILEQEISTGSNADIAKAKRDKQIVFVVEGVVDAMLIASASVCK